MSMNRSMALFRWLLLGETDGGDDSLGHDVRVAVGSRTAVLEVPAAVFVHLPRNTHTGSTVRHARREVVDARGLVATRETALIVTTATRVVGGDVFPMFARKFLDGAFDVRDPHARLTHGKCAEVGVGAGSVPVAGNGLGVEGDQDAEVFGDAVQDEPCHPELVSDGDTFAWTDLWV